MSGRMRAAVGAALALALAGCVIHPAGEAEERAAAEAAGERYAKAFAERALPELSPDASLDALQRRAALANGMLEQRYWEWRAALERIPEMATFGANTNVSFEAMFEDGRTNWNRQLVSIATEPGMGLQWPGKLAAGGAEALAMAQAAGQRFALAGLELAAEARTAWVEWALAHELARLQATDFALLETIAAVAEARARAGAAPQQDWLKTANARDLSRNQLEHVRSTVPARLAALNALLARPADAPLAPPTALPPLAPAPGTDLEILGRVARLHPELLALARMVEAGESGLSLARQQWLPDLSLSAGTSLSGMTQALMGMLMAPVLRWPAIDAGIARADAQLRGAQAMRRQAAHDLAARAVAALNVRADLARQVALFDDTLLPRADEVVTRARAAYTAGQVPLIELLDSQRMLIELRTMRARMAAEHESTVAELEALAAVGAER